MENERVEEWETGGVENFFLSLFYSPIPPFSVSSLLLSLLLSVLHLRRPEQIPTQSRVTDALVADHVDDRGLARLQRPL